MDAKIVLHLLKRKEKKKKREGDKFNICQGTLTLKVFKNWIIITSSNNA